jgi:pterin-4a-carbinolamine dehydratase
MDSKPVEIDGKVPKGTIHSHNKRLNGKLGMKIHSISVVYPFYFPIVFKFTPGHYNDSPVFRKLFRELKPFLEELKLQNILTFVTGDSGYDSIESTSLITKYDCIPCISINKRNEKEHKSKLDMLIFSDERYYCINNLEKALHFDGHDRMTQRLMLKCYHCEQCKDKSTCSKRFKFKDFPDKLSNENLLISKLRLAIFPSEMYKYIYKFRSRIETIHAIWSNELKLENKFYFHNFKELFRFELSILSYSFNHFMNDSSASVRNYFY